MKVSLTRTRTPAANNVGVFLCRNVGVRAIREESAIACITISARPEIAVVIVGAINNMTVFSDTNNASMVRSVCVANISCKLLRVFFTFIYIRACLWHRTTECRVEARRPRVVMGLSVRGGMHEAFIETFPFILDSITLFAV